MAENWPARLYDGVSPRPREASISIEGDSFTLQLAGSPAAVALGRQHLLRNERVGEEYHLEIDPQSIEAPSAKLVVLGRGFEESFHRFLRETDDRLFSGLFHGFQSLPRWCWILIVLAAAPVSYLAITRLFEAAHVLVSLKVEADLGEAVYQHLLKDYPPCEDEALQGELQAMVDGLVDPRSPYRCRVSVCRSPEVNAFALPGGRLVVLTGLLERSGSAEEVLGVVAHEVAHVERRHSLKHLFRSMGVIYFMSVAVGGGFEELELTEAATEAAGILLVLRHSRQAESEADHLAIGKLHHCQRSVEGLIRFFEAVEKEEGPLGGKEVLRWLSSHPLTSSRLEDLRQARQREAFLPRPWGRGREDWKRLTRACAGPPPGPRVPGPGAPGGPERR